MYIEGSLTDAGGLLVGHWTDLENVTGCTVVLCRTPCLASGEVRGGAPGTRETDLLAPGRLVERVDAVVLSGGSAFGLAAADGVMQWLREHGRGYPTAALPVPIVPAAILYDLAVGNPVWPDAAAGWAAAAAAAEQFETGSVGAGTGATVGKFTGLDRATKGGIGTAAVYGRGGLVVSALAGVNALGNVVDPTTGAVIAGARGDDGFVDFAALYGGAGRAGAGAAPTPTAAGPLEHTAIAVVATNAGLGRTELHRVAQVAQDGLARAIRPVHTQHDGDAVFTLSTGDVPADLVLVGEMAAEALAGAVVQAVLAATSLGGIPARRDLPGRR